MWVQVYVDLYARWVRCVGTGVCRSIGQVVGYMGTIEARMSDRCASGGGVHGYYWGKGV